MGAAARKASHAHTGDSKGKRDIAVRGEEELEQVLQRSKNVKGIVADPLYRPVCPENVAFYELPHIAFSGRIYKGDR